MQKLQTLIDVITKGRNLHISILDLSGVLNTPDTKIAFSNVIHSITFCNIAKSTEKGYYACLRCKMLANKKAAAQKEPFSGYCFYGLYEASMPLIINDTVAAVVYVGNAIIDKNKTESKIKKACKITGVNSQKLYAQMNLCEYPDEPEELLKIAQIICDYLKMLYVNSPKTAERHHWLVSALKRHADKAYNTNLVLKDLSLLYHKNEKYMGRLFKSQMGVTFHEYCTHLRLIKAEELLIKSSNKIIDIAFECGFNNISYFNREFQKKNGVSPTEFRKRQKRQAEKSL